MEKNSCYRVFSFITKVSMKNFPRLGSFSIAGYKFKMNPHVLGMGNFIGVKFKMGDVE
jgi:hypothetical protein